MQCWLGSAQVCSAQAVIFGEKLSQYFGEIFKKYYGSPLVSIIRFKLKTLVLSGLLFFTQVKSNKYKWLQNPTMAYVFILYNM